MILAAALGHQGENTAAKESLAEFLRLQPGFINIHRNLHKYQNPADREHLEDGLRKAGFVED